MEEEEAEVERVYTPLYETCRSLLAALEALPNPNRIFHSEASFVATDVNDVSNLQSTAIHRWRAFRDCVKEKSKETRRVWVPRVKTIKEWLKESQEKMHAVRGVMVLEEYFPVEKGFDPMSPLDASLPDPATLRTGSRSTKGEDRTPAPQIVPVHGEGGASSTSTASSVPEPVQRSDLQLRPVDKALEAAEWVISGVSSYLGAAASSLSTYISRSSESPDEPARPAPEPKPVIPPLDPDDVEFTVIRQNWYGRLQRRIYRFCSGHFLRIAPEKGVRAQTPYSDVLRIVVQKEPLHVILVFRDGSEDHLRSDSVLDIVRIVTGRAPHNVDVVSESIRGDDKMSNFPMPSMADEQPPFMQDVETSVTSTRTQTGEGSVVGGGGLVETTVADEALGTSDGP